MSDVYVKAYVVMLGTFDPDERTTYEYYETSEARNARIRQWNKSAICHYAKARGIAYVNPDILIRGEE